MLCTSWNKLWASVVKRGTEIRGVYSYIIVAFPDSVGDYKGEASRTGLLVAIAVFMSQKPCAEVS